MIPSGLYGIVLVSDVEEMSRCTTEEVPDNWTKLSCHMSDANQARLQLFVPAYNPGNFLGWLCPPKVINDWSLRSLQVKLIKMGGRIVRHVRQVVFHLAEVAVSRDLFAAILGR